ncbi:MAG: peptide chain release factor N(5)-glutamine methyltransferase [Prevotellaceae bacterium]|jgi:release factor glutamine methyltransferase|nr:peptide chain release factor N(5)-glutamine methyltransferase [Prevotellaceae bacterium]
MQNSAHTIKYFLNYIRQNLEDSYPAQEARAICHLLLENTLGMTPAVLYASPEKHVEAAQEQQLVEAVAQLRQKRPIQQVLGKAEFYGLTMLVDEHVLIPRPETEELVAWVAKSCQPLASVGSLGNSALHMLDIGTGSGCIAIALAKNLPAAAVHAWDISEKALHVARQNAVRNGVQIHFEKMDILHVPQPRSQKYDVIVSNPPYVCESEKAQMHDNVLRYEPPLALFVRDDNPLVFYAAIAGFAQKALSDGGEVFVEINEKLGPETMEVFTRSGFSSVELRRDINGKPRMARAKR